MSLANKQLIAFLILLAAATYAMYSFSHSTISEMRNNAVAGCERAKATRVELVGFLRDAGRARESEGDVHVAAQYNARADRVEQEIPPSCDDAYDN